MNENEFGDKDQKKRPKIVVEDKRVSYEADEETPAAEPETEPVEPPPESEKPGGPPEEPPAEAKFEQTAEDTGEQTAEKVAQTVFDIGIEGFVQYNLGVVLQFAYVYMGLVANPSTGLVTKELERAKLSVDVFEMLVDKIKDKLPVRDREELMRAVKDLKLNFINAASAPTPPGGQGV